MKTRNLLLTALGAAFFLLILGALPPGASAKTITMDGNFSDWNDVSLLISDSLTGYPYSGTKYYFNTSTDSWQTTEIANACTYTADRALDLSQLKLTNDNNYLYILWKRGSDFLNYYWRRGDATEEANFSSSAATSDNSNPCAGKVVTAPAAFDHDLVLSVDKDKNGSYDYYLVINITFSAGATSSYDTAGYIYQDNGNGTYSKGEETLLGNFGTNEYDVSPSNTAIDSAVLQEVKMDIGKILSDLNLSWGDSVNVRYEAHSTAADTTSAASYTFERFNKPKLSNIKYSKYITKTGKEKVEVKIYGKKLKKNSTVKFGSKKATKTVKKSAHKLVSVFSMKELKKLGHKKLRISVENEDGTLKEWDAKKILKEIEGL